MISDLKEVDGYIQYSHSSQCPHCGEWVEHGDDSCEWNKDIKFTCDCCKKEYIVRF